LGGSCWKRDTIRERPKNATSFVLGASTMISTRDPRRQKPNVSLKRPYWVARRTAARCAWRTGPASEGAWPGCNSRCQSAEEARNRGFGHCQAAPSVSIAESGRIYDSSPASPVSYYMPSLAVNTNGDMIVGFSGSSANQYIGGYYSGKLSSGASPAMPI